MQESAPKPKRSRRAMQVFFRRQTTTAPYFKACFSAESAPHIGPKGSALKNFCVFLFSSRIRNAAQAYPPPTCGNRAVCGSAPNAQSAVFLQANAAEKNCCRQILFGQYICPYGMHTQLHFERGDLERSHPLRRNRL